MFYSQLWFYSFVFILYIGNGNAEFSFHYSAGSSELWVRRTNASLQAIINNTSEDVAHIMLDTLNQIDNFHRETWDVFRKLVATTLQLYLEIEETRNFANFTINEEIPEQIQSYKEKLKLVQNEIQQIRDEGLQHFEVENVLRSTKQDSLSKLEKPQKMINELERNLTTWRDVINETANILPGLQNLTKTSIFVLMREIENILEELRNDFGQHVSMTVVNLQQTTKDLIEVGSMKKSEFYKQFHFLAEIIKNKFMFAQWGMISTLQGLTNYMSLMKEDIAIGISKVQGLVLSSEKIIESDIKLMKKLSCMQIYKAQKEDERLLTYWEHLPFFGAEDRESLIVIKIENQDVEMELSGVDGQQENYKRRVIKKIVSDTTEFVTEEYDYFDTGLKYTNYYRYIYN